MLAAASKSGYTFVYTPGTADTAGNIDTYSITATPVVAGTTGQRRYFPDQSGVIRADASGSGASVNSTPIGEIPPTATAKRGERFSPFLLFSDRIEPTVSLPERPEDRIVTVRHADSRIQVAPIKKNRFTVSPFLCSITRRQSRRATPPHTAKANTLPEQTIGRGFG